MYHKLLKAYYRRLFKRSYAFTPRANGLITTKTMDSGPAKKDAATYLAATDMPAYNIIDPDTLHVTDTADLIFPFGKYSSFLNF
jgi:hypothetical protein